MSKNVKNHDAEEAIEHALTSTEHVIEKYKKPILYGVIAVIAIAALSLGYQHLIRKPKMQEAMAQTFLAEQYFRADSFALALNGDGNAYGFKKIIDEYGTLAGEAVYFYAGICELQLGQYKNAIDYLKKYDGDDQILSARALACIGDAHAGLQENKEAINYYLKAANFAENAFAAEYLLKAGIMYEELGEKDNAIKTYQEIKDKYPQTVEGYEIDKYISRIQQQ
ncbi:hypothetical protein SDC9_121465 [bioreactor metagenome]|uniref:Tetratricopeptide repeat-like domain-containing protein n=1 Tax=bioreactor metagenome TaxID=1076179 RepID=A0A645CC11_9ZZZZ